MRTSTRRYLTETREHHKRVRDTLLDMGYTMITSSSSGSFYVTGLRTKYVPRWQCLEWEGELLTPGEIARSVMVENFPSLKRIGNWRGDHIKLLRLRWPMYFQVPYFGECVYYDLVSAYWQFYSRLWLDVGYPCGYGTLDLAPVAEKLIDIKKARNAVIGITRSTDVSFVKRGKRWKVPTRNKFLSPPLWANLMGWLQEIASEAISRGACYCMMDGYFFPQSADHAGFEKFLADYGLNFHKKTGNVHIIGWGSYKTDWGRTTHLYRNKARGTVDSVGRHFSDPYKILNWWQKSIDFRMWRFKQ